MPNEAVRGSEWLKQHTLTATGPFRLSQRRKVVAPRPVAKSVQCGWDGDVGIRTAREFWNLADPQADPDSTPPHRRGRLDARDIVTPLFG